MTVQIAATARLRLRTADLADSAFFQALLNDPGFIAQIGDRGVRTLDEARQALIEGPIAMQDARGHSLWIVERKEDGVPVGMCGLIKRETLDGVDIGYAFLEAYCGRGYAYEAGRAVLAHAPTLGLRRVLAITSPNNLPSNGLLRKLGMRFERFVHLTPEDAGSNLYSLDLPAG
jgi:RimJ/RimL family protein N-acetyltransferase